MPCATYDYSLGQASARGRGGFMVHSPPEVYIIWGKYGDPITICPKPYSIYLRGTIGFRATVALRPETPNPGPMMAGMRASK